MTATAGVVASADGAGSEDPADPLTPVDVLLDDAHGLIDDEAIQVLLDLLLAREKNVVTGPARTTAAADQQASVTRRVPVVTLAKSGPQSIGTAQTASYPLSLSNVGAAAATIATTCVSTGRALHGSCFFV